MREDIKTIKKLLEVIKDIELENNKILGFIAQQVSPRPPECQKMGYVVEFDEKMIGEIVKYHAEEEIVGES